MQVRQARSRSTPTGNRDAEYALPAAGELVLDPQVFRPLRELLEAGVLAQIYGEFLGQTRERIATLLAGHGGAEAVAHTIRGTAGMLGARAISARAERLEAEARLGRCFADLVEQMRQDCRALEAALREERIEL